MKVYIVIAENDALTGFDNDGVYLNHKDAVEHAASKLQKLDAPGENDKRRVLIEEWDVQGFLTW